MLPIRKSITTLLALSIFAAPIFARVARADDAVVAAAKAEIQKRKDEVAAKEAELAKFTADLDSAVKVGDNWLVTRNLTLGGLVISGVVATKGASQTNPFKYQRSVVITAGITFMLLEIGALVSDRYFEISQEQMSFIKADIEEAKKELYAERVALNAVSSVLQSAGQ